MFPVASCDSSRRLTDDPPVPRDKPIAQNGRQTLEIHHGRRQVDLDRDIRQAATRGPAQAMLRLRFTVNALHPPSVTRIKGAIFRQAFDVPASGAK